jgi:hypothetical protein
VDEVTLKMTEDQRNIGQDPSPSNTNLQGSRSGQIIEFGLKVIPPVFKWL